MSPKLLEGHFYLHKSAPPKVQSKVSIYLLQSTKIYSISKHPRLVQCSQFFAELKQ